MILLFAGVDTESALGVFLTTAVHVTEDHEGMLPTQPSRRLSSKEGEYIALGDTPDADLQTPRHQRQSSLHKHSASVVATPLAACPSGTSLIVHRSCWQDKESPISDRISCEEAAQAIGAVYRQNQSWNKGTSPVCLYSSLGTNPGVYFNSDKKVPLDKRARHEGLKPLCQVNLNSQLPHHTPWKIFVQRAMQPAQFLPLTAEEAQLLHDQTLPIALKSPPSFKAWRDKCAACQNLAHSHVPADKRRSDGQKKKVAILMFGEAFRTEMGGRATCDEGTTDEDEQKSVFVEHLLFFKLLEEWGYAVDMFGVTALCTSGRFTNEEDRLQGAETLSKWYGGYLRTPIVVFPKLDQFPNAQFRKRQVSVLLMERYQQSMGDKFGEYDHAIQIRWDLHVNARNFPSCLLGDRLVDAQNWGTDFDRAIIVPRKFIKCWKCLIKSDRAFLNPGRNDCSVKNIVVNNSDFVALVGVLKVQNFSSYGTTGYGRPCFTSSCHGPGSDDAGYVGDWVKGGKAGCWDRFCGWAICLNVFHPEILLRLSQQSNGSCSAQLKRASDWQQAAACAGKHIIGYNPGEAGPLEKNPAYNEIAREVGAATPQEGSWNPPVRIKLPEGPWDTVSPVS
jgi:hypothetical protein